MEILEWIFIRVIIPVIGGFIGSVIFVILKNKMED